MTAVMVAGAAAGLGLFLLVLAVMPRRASLTRRVADYDLARAAARPGALGPRDSGLASWLGSSLARICAERGWEFPSTRANLSVVGKPFENYIATKVLLGLFGLFLAPVLTVMLGLAGVHLPLLVPVWLALLLGLIFFLLPDLELKQEAGKRRRDFRHAIGAFLDLVAMNLAGGRGVPEALMSASEIGDGWAMWRIKDALLNARITGQTPWQALGDLGVDVQVDELRDLSAALGLVAEDGAKVRETLATRAASLRRKELAEAQGQAAERSQSMLVAQLLLVIAFLIFLIYPAARLLIGV